MLFYGVIREFVFLNYSYRNYSYIYSILTTSGRGAFSGETPRADPVFISGVVIRFVSGTYLPLHHKKAFLKADHVITPEMVRLVAGAFLWCNNGSFFLKL